MRPDHEITDGIKLGAVALVSAVLTATVVIGMGRAMLPEAEVQARVPETALVRVALR